MRFHGWFGVLLLLVSEYCLFRKIEPFHSWFYCFAWWSYILIADSLLQKLRGRPLFSNSRGELGGMLVLSVFIWLIFEGFNLVLHNWAYVGVPSEIWLRWGGYGLAFATVLPGMFVTSDLIELCIYGRHDGPSASETDKLGQVPCSKPSHLFMLFGLLLCMAPLVWPRYFFAAIWLGPIFLLDPLLERAGIRSLSLCIASGSRRRIWSLLLGGLACGIMWEFWNYWAASKWVYSVPFFGRWRVFEMPLLGFLGFPPFALECWILYHLMREGLRRTSPVYLRVALWMLIGAGCFLVFYCIDRQTVLGFAHLGLS